MAGLTEKNVVFTVGGYNGKEAATDVEVLNLTSGGHCWDVGPPLQVARRGFGLVAYNGELYAVGGFNDDRGSLRSVEILDLATLTWSDGPPMPSARYDLGLSVHRGRIFAVGGRGSGGRVLGTVESFDPSLRRWLTHGSLLTCRAGLGVASAFAKRASNEGDMLFAVGGDVGTVSITPVSLTEYFDFSANCWEHAPGMAERRCDPGIVAHGAKVFAMGGVGGGPGAGGFLSSLEIFDTITWAWAPGPALSFDHSGIGGAALAGSIFICGGSFSGAHRTETSVLNVERLAWEQAPKLETRRWGVRVAAVEGEKVRDARVQAEERLKARWRIQDAIAQRHVENLRAALDLGRRLGLDEGELIIGTAMVEHSRQTGVMAGFTVPQLQLQVPA